MKRLLNKLKDTKAFTLLEMAIVLFIISALLLIVIPNIGTHQDTAEGTGNEALQVVINTQADLYEIETGNRPGSLSDLAAEGYLNAAQLEEATNKGLSITGSGS